MLEDSDCDGSLQTVIDNTTCDINIATLLASPYNIDGGDSIWAKLVATNVYGDSEQSFEGNGAYYTRIPDSPINLQEDRTDKTSSTLKVTWTDGPNDGGLSLLDYKVKMRV